MYRIPLPKTLKKLSIYYYFICSRFFCKKETVIDIVEIQNGIIPKSNNEEFGFIDEFANAITNIVNSIETPTSISDR